MRAVLTVLLGTALLLAPAFLNRAPYIFYDTGEYLRLGRALLAGFHDFRPDRIWLTFLGGRAISYSLFLVAMVKLGTIWLPAVAQSLCGAFLLFALANTVSIGRAGYLALTCCLSLFTPAGFFSAFLMPDVFCAYALIIILIFLLDADRMGGLRAVLLGILLTFSISVHSTNAVLAALALIFGLVAKARLDRGSLWTALRSCRVPVYALLASVMLVSTGSLVVRLGAGEPLRSPPYLMARVLADGPGRAFVRRDCRAHPFLICSYSGKPLDDSDEILWSSEAGTRVVQDADHAGRVTLKDQEIPFVLSAIGRYPMMELRASIANALTQLSFSDARPQMSLTREVAVPLFPAVPNSVPIIENSRDYRGDIDWDLISGIDRAALLLSLLLIPIRLARSDFRAAWSRDRASRSAARREREIAIVIISGLGALILANAIVCGMLSGPSARYQARLIWLVPAACFLLHARFGWRAAERGES